VSDDEALGASDDEALDASDDEAAACAAYADYDEFMADVRHVDIDEASDDDWDADDDAGSDHGGDTDDTTDVTDAIFTMGLDGVLNLVPALEYELDGDDEAEVDDPAAHLKEPLYADASVTVGAALYALLQAKQASKAKDGLFDDLFHYLHKHLLPQPNHLPGSLYMAKKAIGVPRLQDFERQACPNSCRVWPHLPRKQWAAHQSDECEVCKCKRFVARVLPSGTVRLRPAKATWPEDPSPWVGRIDRFIAFEANRPGDVQPHVFRIAVMKLWRVAANNISSNRDVVRGNGDQPLCV
jgi:hypothetical protein